MRTAVAVIVALLITSGLAQAQRTSSGVDADVLNALVRSLCADKDLQPPPGKYNIISGQTSLVYSQTVDQISPDAVASLRARNAKPHELPRVESCSTERFNPTIEVKGEAAWKAFFAKFPDAVGLTEFSMPGYTSSHKQAIVGVSFRCNYYCAFGGYWVLEKQPGGKWRVVRKVHAWMT
jgi:hypothetical protein